MAIKDQRGATGLMTQDPNGEIPLEQVVGILKALAHPIRFRIMLLLADKQDFGLEDPGCCDRQEVCVCRINESFDITAPTLSHHLKLLREAGLIEGRRDGVWIYYTIRPETQVALRAALTQIVPQD
jgi:ArsR family transcriptional regulator